MKFLGPIIELVFFAGVYGVSLCLADSTNTAPTLISVPPGSRVVIITNAPPPTPPEVPLSVQMRRAAQLAKGKDAPFTQRFVATRVKEDPRSRDRAGLLVFSTNYFVTFTPVSDETNAPIAYGATKSKTFTLEVEFPVKKGDEFLFFPSE